MFLSLNVDLPDLLELLKLLLKQSVRNYVYLYNKFLLLQPSPNCKRLTIIFSVNKCHQHGWSLRGLTPSGGTKHMSLKLPKVAT